MAPLLGRAPEARGGDLGLTEERKCHDVFACAGIATIGVTLNATEFGYVFVGVDTVPDAACLDFGDAVHESGLTMRFTDVPILNSTQKVKEVIVKVEP